jgi:hypothetical protein
VRVCRSLSRGEPTAAELAQHPNLLLRTARQPCAACPTLSTRSPHCRRRRPERGSGVQLLATHDAAAAQASRPARQPPHSAQLTGSVRMRDTHSHRPPPAHVPFSACSLRAWPAATKAQNGPNAHIVRMGCFPPMEVPPLLHTRSGTLSTASAAHRLRWVRRHDTRQRSRGRTVLSDAHTRIMRFELHGAASLTARQWPTSR